MKAALSASPADPTSAPMQTNPHSALEAGLQPFAASEAVSMGPLGWVYEELRQCLQEADATLLRFVSDNVAARSGDLAEIDASELRLLSQRLHQAVGALELVELAAAAQTLRALEAAVGKLIAKPALATEAAAAAVSAGCRVLLDFLWRELRQRPVSPQALYPTYLAWQQLAGAARIHPADLWPCEPRMVPLPAGPALTPEPALRTRLERHVLAVVKSRDAAAAAALVPLTAGLARGASVPEAAQYWLAAAACFEALAEGCLPDTLYVKRAVTGVLTQYNALAQGRFEPWARHTHDLLYLVAHLPAAAIRIGSLHVQAIRQTYGWQPPDLLGQSESNLGQDDSLRLAQAQSALHAAQRAWERRSAGEGGDQFGAAMQRLGGSLDALWQGLPQSAVPDSTLQPSADAVAPSSDPSRATSWGRVCTDLVQGLSHDPAAWPPGLALEVSSTLLCLGAELDDFDAHPQIDSADSRSTERVDANAAYQRQQDLLQRLHACAHGLPLPPAPSWMSERYRNFSERQSQAALYGQMRSDLNELERALETWLQAKQSVPTAMPDEAIWPRFDALYKIAEWLDLKPVVSTLGAMRRWFAALETASASQRAELESAQWLADNFSALELLLEAMSQQTELASEAFAFDPATERLQALRPVASAATSAPQINAAVDAAGVTKADADSVSELSESDDLLEVFLDEAQALQEQITQSLAALQLQPDSAPNLLATRRAFHTLKGSARMVGQTQVGQLAWGVEQVLNTWLADRLPATPDLLQQCATALERIREALGLGSTQASDAASTVEFMRPELPAAPIAEASLPLQSPPDPERVPLLRDALQLPPVLDQPVKEVGPLRIELDLFNVFLAEADDWSRRLLQGLEQPELATVPPLFEWSHALAGGAATVGHEGLSQLARALEQALERLLPVAGGARLQQPVQAVLIEAAQQMRAILHQFAAGVLRNPQPETLAALAGLVPSSETRSESGALRVAGAAPGDRSGEVTSTPQSTVVPEAELAPAFLRDLVLDPAVFAVFDDEAQQLLPQLGAALRQWKARPQHGVARSELLRHLHTLKGSARLAGAMQLGERLHRLESRVLALPDVPESTALHALEPELEQVEADLAQLRRRSAQAKVKAQADVPVAHRPSHAVAEFAPELLQPSPVVSTLRVRADWLDRLVLHAADLSLSRTRIESDLLGVRRSFEDMATNVARLRSQLRELELQTESQRSPAVVQGSSPDPRFDPLELDRYTRSQELTRLMAEAINDVAVVQHQLQRAMQSAEGNLAAQTRQTRDLQRDLLRSRLVAFDSLGERLQRCVRLAAEDCGKTAELRLEHGELELERSVLERLVPVLEHLLRNAVVHGLETDVQRHLLRKPLPGRISIALQSHDKDLSITLSDDGAGLDSERIHQRAIALGLHPKAGQWSLEQAQRLVFAVGLSTADEVTQVAGRGIGLDAVRSEVRALGGRIDCLAPPAGGCAFRLWLPRSSSFSQVQMLRVGDFVFGVPSDLVLQVHQAQAPALTAAYVRGRWSSEAAGPIAFHWAGALLALSAESTDEASQQARQWQVVEFYSAGQRVAWHVDEVLEVQEVVLKPLGPPLVGLPGLAGATALASGAVCLIYNPVALTALCAEAARQWVREHRAGATSKTAATQATPVGPAAAPLVLVVDDSITVRRVTQRLLQREGYRVALASDGVQALQRLAVEQPAVMLCDIEMPRMDGFELLHRMRLDPRWADLPTIMITSRLAEKHRQHARTLGVEHYLGKPYSELELLAWVREACARSAQP